MTDMELALHDARGKLARQVGRWAAVRACEDILRRHTPHPTARPCVAVPVKV